MELALKRNRNEAHPQIVALWAAGTSLAGFILSWPTCSPLPGTISFLSSFSIFFGATDVASLCNIQQLRVYAGGDKGMTP